MWTEKLFLTIVQKEVSLSSLRHKEEKEMTKLFHIKSQVKPSNKAKRSIQAAPVEYPSPTE